MVEERAGHAVMSHPTRTVMAWRRATTSETLGMTLGMTPEMTPEMALQWVR